MILLYQQHRRRWQKVRIQVVYPILLFSEILENCNLVLDFLAFLLNKKHTFVFVEEFEFVLTLLGWVVRFCFAVLVGEMKIQFWRPHSFGCLACRLFAFYYWFTTSLKSQAPLVCFVLPLFVRKAPTWSDPFIIIFCKSQFVHSLWAYLFKKMLCAVVFGIPLLSRRKVNSSCVGGFASHLSEKRTPCGKISVMFLLSECYESEARGTNKKLNIFERSDSERNNIVESHQHWCWWAMLAPCCACSFSDVCC